MMISPQVLSGERDFAALALAGTADGALLMKAVIAQLEEGRRSTIRQNCIQSRALYDRLSCRRFRLCKQKRMNNCIAPDFRDMD
jgi:hypothetical protein